VVTLVHSLEDFTVMSGLKVVGGAVFARCYLLAGLLKVLLDDLKPTPFLFADAIAESFFASPAEVLGQVVLEGST